MTNGKPSSAAPAFRRWSCTLSALLRRQSRGPARPGIVPAQDAQVPFSGWSWWPSSCCRCRALWLLAFRARWMTNGYLPLRHSISKALAQLPAAGAGRVGGPPGRQPPARHRRAGLGQDRAGPGGHAAAEPADADPVPHRRHPGPVGGPVRQFVHGQRPGRPGLDLEGHSHAAVPHRLDVPGPAQRLQGRAEDGGRRPRTEDRRRSTEDGRREAEMPF